MFSRLSCKKVFLPANLILIFALTLFFMCVPGVAGALELTVSPTGLNNDQSGNPLEQSDLTKLNKLKTELL